MDIPKKTEALIFTFTPTLQPCTEQERDRARTELDGTDVYVTTRDVLAEASTAGDGVVGCESCAGVIFKRVSLQHELFFGDRREFAK